LPQAFAMSTEENAAGSTDFFHLYRRGQRMPNATRSRAIPIGIATTSVSEGERAEAFLPAGVEEEVDSEIEELFPAFVVIAELVDRMPVEVPEAVEVVEVMEEELVLVKVLLELNELDEVDEVVDLDEDASDEEEVITEVVEDVETVDDEEVVEEPVEEEEDCAVAELVVEPDDEVCVEPIAEKEYRALPWIQS